MTTETLKQYVNAVQELIDALAWTQLISTPDRIGNFQAAFAKVNELQPSAVVHVGCDVASRAVSIPYASPAFILGDGKHVEPAIGDGPSEPLTEDEFFAIAYRACAAMGKSDEWGSAESHRVYREWCEAGKPIAKTQFILEHANKRPA